MDKPKHMHEMIKIVFMDIDGTLLSEVDRTLSPRTERSIQELLRRGIQVVLVTGRPYNLCEEFRRLGIDTIISANGALIKSGEQVIHKSVLSPDMVRTFSEFAQENGHGISYFTETFEMNGDFETDVRITDALRDTLGIMEYPGRINSLDSEIYCLCLYADQAEAEIYHRQFPSLNFVRFHEYVSNVLEENMVSKSSAAEKVLTFLNISREEAMAFGDGENDIDLLEYVGLGVAMGNGGERIKLSADYITRKASEDGIMHALKAFKLIY